MGDVTIEYSSNWLENKLGNKCVHRAQKKKLIIFELTVPHTCVYSDVPSKGSTQTTISSSATSKYSLGHSIASTDCSQSVTIQSLGTSQLLGPSSPIIVRLGNC